MGKQTVRFPSKKSVESMITRLAHLRACGSWARDQCLVWNAATGELKIESFDFAFPGFDEYGELKSPYTTRTDDSGTLVCMTGFLNDLESLFAAHWFPAVDNFFRFFARYAVWADDSITSDVTATREYYRLCDKFGVTYGE